MLKLTGIFLALSMAVAVVSAHDFLARGKAAPTIVEWVLGSPYESERADTDILPAAHAEQPRQISVAPFVMPPKAHFVDVVGRPLFAETRRPPKPLAPKPKKVAKAPPPPPPPPVKRGQFSLAGVIMEGDRTYALVRKKGNNELLRVTEGQLVDKWRIDEINPTELVLSQRNIRETVRLHVAEEEPETKTVRHRPGHRLRNALKDRRRKNGRQVVKKNSPTSFVRALRTGNKTKTVNAVKKFGLTAVVGNRRATNANQPRKSTAVKK